MISRKIFQWDERYPTYEDFARDIQNGEAFVAETAEKTGFENRKKIVAVYVLNKDFDEAYKTGTWQYDGNDYIVIHRFCVNPAFQHKGIGFKVCSHILAQAKNDVIKAVRAARRFLAESLFLAIVRETLIQNDRPRRLTQRKIFVAGKDIVGKSQVSSQESDRQQSRYREYGFGLRATLKENGRGTDTSRPT